MKKLISTVAAAVAMALPASSAHAAVVAPAPRPYPITTPAGPYPAANYDNWSVRTRFTVKVRRVPPSLMASVGGPAVWAKLTGQQRRDVESLVRQRRAFMVLQITSNTYRIRTVTTLGMTLVGVGVLAYTFGDTVRDVVKGAAAVTVFVGSVMYTGTHRR